MVDVQNGTLRSRSPTPIEDSFLVIFMTPRWRGWAIFRKVRATQVIFETLFNRSAFLAIIYQRFHNHKYNHEENITKEKLVGYKIVAACTIIVLKCEAKREQKKNVRIDGYETIECDEPEASHQVGWRVLFLDRRLAVVACCYRTAIIQNL